MTNCACNTFQPLLTLGAVEERIEHGIKISSVLDKLAENPIEHITLFRCTVCGQYWQSSWEWGLGGIIYYFKVPEIGLDDWLQEPYIQPSQLMVYGSALSKFFDFDKLKTTGKKCKKEGCEYDAIQYSVFCLEHHLEQLHTIGSFPEKPHGRLFPPYHFPRIE